MVVLSKQDWLQNIASSDIKICVLGLTLRTDSPRLLLLTVTCGVVSVSLVSGRWRSFLLRVWRDTCSCFCRYVHWPTPVSARANAIDPVQVPTASTSTITSLPTLKMGQKMTVITSVQLETDPEVDQLLMSAYETRLRPRTTDAQTSPLTIHHLDVAINTILCSNDRGCSPLSIGELSDHDELLLIFGEEGSASEGAMNGCTTGSFLEAGHADHSELYDKLEKIQKQLQEANQEMDQTMNRMAELSQKHFYAEEYPFVPADEASSDLDYGDVLNSLRALQSGKLQPQRPQESSADSAQGGLTWEDEFGGSSIKPLRRSLDNLSLWQSDLSLYAHLHIANNRFSLPSRSSAYHTSSPPVYTNFQDVLTPSPILSPVQGLPPVQTRQDQCVQCSREKQEEKLEKRPLSAPCHSAVSLSCASCISSTSSTHLHSLAPCASHTCRSVPTVDGSPPTAHRSPQHDRVPKLKQQRPV